MTATATATTKRPLISLEKVSAAYDGKSVLRDVNLTIYERDFLGVVGPNGGGKTTLVKIILGLMKPTQGQVRYFKEGRPIDKIKIGYLPQYSSIDKKFPISVGEVILSGLSGERSILSPFGRRHAAQVRSVMERLHLAGYGHRSIAQLSGGELQRVLLGRAIVSRPHVVILDEPSTYLDKRSEEQLYPLLDELNRESAIVLVSHDIGTILQNVKTVACVNEELDYHPDTELSPRNLEAIFGCPIELLGHGALPHRVLLSHSHDDHPGDTCHCHQTHPHPAAEPK